VTRSWAVVIGAAGIAAGLASEYVRQVWIQPLWVPLIDLAVGQLLIWCGLVAAVARPQQPAGRRLVLAGFLWIVGAPRQWFPNGGMTDDFFQLDSISFTLVGWSDVVLAFIALSFASRWPTRRRDTAVAAVLVAAYGIQTAARVMARADVLLGMNVPDSILGAVAPADIGRLTALGVAGVLILQRWLATSPPSRYLLGPVLLAGAVSSLVPLYGLWYPLSQLGFVAPLPTDLTVPTFWVTNALRALVPIAMLLGILRQRGSRAAVADAIAAVGPAASSRDLEVALGQALSDPSLRVLSWDDAMTAYLDARGEPTPLPTPGGTMVATFVPGADGPLAALVHDRALTEDSALVAAGVNVTRLVIDNARLNRTLQHQLDQVRASRARIVEAGDAERRRIERDLHDGVQQRLLALALGLRRAEALASGDPAAAAALRRGAEEALGVVGDVRELAQGIHPAVLTEAGLPAALRALADRSPVPVDLELALDGALSPGVAATAYFVASEALANVVKHASAATARLLASESDGRVVITVEDDGRGGANPRGDGLRGLDDRLAAIGGTLSVAERSGGGTVVSATIPIR
jgi:signal transduction histidine kinase